MTWKVIGASEPGTVHQKSGAGCQDAFGFRVLPNGYLIIAVADGAGSALHAKQGAELAVFNMLNLLQRPFSRKLPLDNSRIEGAIKAAFYGTRQALLSCAEKNKQPLSTFATTLSCVIAAPEWLGMGHLGDTAVVIKTGNGRLKLLNEPQRGEFANDSYFITMPDVLRYCQCEVYPKYVKGIAMTTDGMLRLALKLPEHKPHPQFFKPLFTFAEAMDDPMGAEQELRKFLVSGPVNMRTDDDKTLVLATRTEEASYRIALKKSFAPAERKAGES